MGDQIYAFFCALAGSDPPHINPAQATFRAVVVYALAILIIRCGNRRMFGKSTVFDNIIGIVLGSVLSRTINGSAPFWPTRAASAALVGAHWSIAALTFYSKTAGAWIKGADRVLVRDGEQKRDALRRSHISEDDLREELRLGGKLDDPGQVKVARLERNGEVSVMLAKRVEVVDIHVEAGVQTVRLQVESK